MQSSAKAWGGENDTRFGIGLTWQAGMSLAQHLDPDGVGARRSLAGSRHDLVERNNNIVLEYRKKELVKLRLHDPVQGKPKESKALVASLQSKYALKTLHMEAATLTAAGGSYSIAGDQVTVVLPDYRYTTAAQVDNSYVVAVTAEDIKGNRSSNESTTIVVQAPVLSPADSVITVAPDTLPADGKSQSTVTFHARDAQGQGIPGLKPEITLMQKNADIAGTGATVSAVSEGSDGRYTATLTAGTTAGSVTVKPVLDGTRVGSLEAVVTVKAGGIDASLSTFTASPDEIVAGGVSTLTFTARDAHGNAVTGATGLEFIDMRFGVEVGTVSEGSDGRYTATLTETTAGPVYVVPELDGTWMYSLEIVVKVVNPFPPVEVVGLSTNGYTFGPREGFPSTGFKGATFTVDIKNGDPKDYSWTATPEWVTVSDKGEVKLGQGKPAEVKITGMPRSEAGVKLEYTFTLSAWFTPVGLSTGSSLSTVCTAAGHRYHANPDKHLLAGGRGVGWLVGEWGISGVRTTLLGLIEVSKGGGVIFRYQHGSIISTVGNPVRAITLVEATNRVVGIRQISTTSGKTLGFYGPVLCVDGTN